MGTLLASAIYKRYVPIQRGYYQNSLNSGEISSCSCSTVLGALLLSSFGLVVCYCIKREATWAKIGVLLITVVSVLILLVPFVKRKTKLNKIPTVQSSCPPETKHVVIPIASHMKKTENSPSPDLTIGTSISFQSSLPSYENISVVS